MSVYDYQRDGFIVLRKIFNNEEIKAMDQECQRLLASDIVDPANIRTPFRFGAETCPERIDPVVDISPLFERLIQDDRLVAQVADLLGDQPKLFKDKLILKAPGVAGYEMHQDWAWGWQNLCPANDILSVSIQIDGAAPDNGGIELFPGYHHELLTPAGMATNFRQQELDRVDQATASRYILSPVMS